MAYLREAVLLVTLCTALSSALKLQEKFAWKQLLFDWPTPEAEQEAIQTGRYVPQNNLPLGVEKWQNKLFVTVPRWVVDHNRGAVGCLRLYKILLTFRGFYWKFNFQKWVVLNSFQSFIMIYRFITIGEVFLMVDLHTQILFFFWITNVHIFKYLEQVSIFCGISFV